MASRVFGCIVLSLSLLHPLTGQGQRTATPEIRDSVGIAIIEYSSWPPTVPQWSLPAAPQTRIGSVGGGPASFGSINGIVEQGDGSIVVADGQAKKLIAFDSAGRLLWSVGRSGMGPGEFPSDIIMLARLPGDTLVAADIVSRRLSAFSPSGVYLRQVPLNFTRNGLLSTAVVGVLDNGTLVTRAAVARSDQSSGYNRQPETFSYYSRNREFIHLGTFPGPEFITGTRVMPGPNGNMVEAQFGQFLYMGRRTLFAIGERYSALVSQDSLEVIEFDERGKHVRTIRIRMPRVSVEGSIGERARAARPGAVLPDELPVIGHVFYDRQDRLWLQEFVPPHERRDPAWWILDRAGDVVARIRLSQGFTPYVVSGNHIWGVQLDELDVPHVERWQIRIP
jgi:hypothetical protein